MTVGKMVVPLGLGLCAVLGPAAPGEDVPPPPRPAVRVYTNEDLDRVRPFRAETGVTSVPAAPSGPVPERPDPRTRRRGEEYWRREAARVRERVREMGARVAELRVQVAERAEESGRTLGRRRGASSSGAGSVATLRARLAALEQRIRQAEDDLLDRARREGALPGWLRE
jgi:hypothetical protein